MKIKKDKKGRFLYQCSQCLRKKKSEKLLKQYDKELWFCNYKCQNKFFNYKRVPYPKEKRKISYNYIRYKKKKGGKHDWTTTSKIWIRATNKV